MDLIWWIISGLLLLVGFAGSVLPFVPGTTLIFAGVIFHRLMLGEEAGVGWGVVIVLAVMLLVSYAMDFASGAIGAKWFGASRWGAIGGILGATVGLFFGLPGLFLGPLVGALLGELLGGKGLLPAGQSGIGTVIGTTAGIIAKFCIALAMIILFVLALTLGW